MNGSGTKKTTGVWSREYLERSRHFLWDKDFLPVLYKFLKLSSRRRILDVACGLGHLALMMEPKAPRIEKIIGIDIDTALLRSARKAARNAASSVKFRKMDASAMKFKDGSFDLCAAMTLFVNLHRPEPVLSEMVRVTSPGGIVAAIEPIYQTDGNNEFMPGYTEAEYRFMSRLRRRKSESSYFVPDSQKYIAARLPHMFSEAGLTDIDAKSFGYAHVQKWSRSAYESYLERLDKQRRDIEEGHMTPEKVKKELPVTYPDEARDYLRISRNRARRILKNRSRYRDMIYTNVYQLLVIRGRKGER